MKDTIPTDAGLVHFFEAVRAALADKYQLNLTASLNEFEVRDVNGKLIAAGRTIQWVSGFLNGLDAANNTWFPLSK